MPRYLLRPLKALGDLLEAPGASVRKSKKSDGYTEGTGGFTEGHGGFTECLIGA